MKRAILFALVAAPLVFAQPAVPQLGLIRDSRTSVRPVLGIAGNLLLGDPIATDVVLSSFSGKYGIVKTSTALLILKSGEVISSTDVPDGAALFAFRATGAPALVWLPKAGAMMRWHDDHFEAMQWNVDGEVIALATVDDATAAAVIHRGDALWTVTVALNSGDTQDQAAITGVTGSVFLANDGTLIFRNPDGLVIRRIDGTELAFPASLTSAVFSQIADDWIQIADDVTSVSYALRLTRGREELNQLPDAAEGVTQ